MDVQRYMFRHDESRNVYASAGRERNPSVKKKNPATHTVSRHFFPTSSVERTIVHVPTMDLPNPDTNRRAAYAHTFGEKAVSTPATDIDTMDVSSIFLRPRSESARVVRRKPPARQPAKNEDAGRETSAGPAHLSDHSETTDVTVGRSHAHAPAGRAHGEAAAAEHDASEPVQCHCGSASVNTEMNTCCASKAHAKASRTALRSCVAPVVPMYVSIVSSIDGAFPSLALWLVRSGAVAVSAIGTVACVRACFRVSQLPLAYLGC